MRKLKKATALLLCLLMTFSLAACGGGTTKETGGTGLGLSIVKHGAILHNAKIDIDSVLNKGTAITLTFEKAI